MEGGGCLSLGIPEEHHDDAHHPQLVDVVPRLHHHAVKSKTTILGGGHQVFVVQSTYSTQYGGKHHEVDPLVLLEVDAFLLATSAKHEEREDGQQHTYPLIKVESLAKDE